MKWFDALARNLGYMPVPKESKRSGYQAAASSRLTADWARNSRTEASNLRMSLAVMRDRSRDLARNNSVARGFGKALLRNVLGANGIKLQMKVRNQDGTMDRRANAIIEEAWAEWGQSKACDLARRLSWRQMERQALLRAAFDGEALAQTVPGDDGPYRFAVQLLEPDLLDEQFCEARKNGNRIFSSVEMDERRRPVAYWLLGRHPGADFGEDKQKEKRYPLPWTEIVHAFIQERPTQIRGVPWLVSAMQDIRMIGGYKEAELVAARVSAAKAGFFVRKNLDGPDGLPTASDESGNRQIEVEPGVFEELPAGYEFQPWDPTHPNQAFGDFIKSQLRTVATGLGVSYHTLSSDLEGVNYSSIRAGVLDEREEWMQVQDWFVTDFHTPIFRRWLSQALSLGLLGSLPVSRFEKFAAGVTWCGRRWPWVDPEKDINASRMSVESGFRSPRRIVAEMGGDLEDTLEEIKEDLALAKEMGVPLMFGDSPVVINTTAKTEADGATAAVETQSGTVTDNVQALALNGAQVQALQQIIQAVASGQLPAASASAMIKVAFPDFDDATIQAMVGAAEAFEPEEPDKPSEPVAKQDQQT